VPEVAEVLALVAVFVPEVPAAAVPVLTIAVVPEEAEELPLVEEVEVELEVAAVILNSTD